MLLKKLLKYKVFNKWNGHKHTIDCASLHLVTCNFKLLWDITGYWKYERQEPDKLKISSQNNVCSGC